jgi:uncharacterized damage-inducible protein DinB
MTEGFQDLTGSRFDRADLSGSTFSMVLFDRSWIRNADFRHVEMRGVEIEDTTISGEIKNFVINGIDVAPLVDAELDRRHPERPKFRPVTAEGFREAWDVNQRLWTTTVDRARALPPGLLHESVDEEWSFIQTLRHLAFASESWVGRCIEGDPSPWHPLSLPWDTTRVLDGVPHDRDARPSLDEALALRHDAMALVRRVVDAMTDQRLSETTEPCVGPGWPPEGETFEVRECLLVVLNEEWWHRTFAERDLAVLERRG